MVENKNKKILLTGGGTGGSVSPLLAIYESITSPLTPLLIRRGEERSAGERYDFLWVGTKNGIEKEMVEQEGIKYISIPSGKMRRYFSWRNFIDPIFIFAGLCKSIFIVFKYRPDIVISAGSFVSVPVVWAAWLLGVPVLIHQQDVRPGLANQLMAPFARVVTVTFEKSLKDYKKRGEWVGNFVRQSLAGISGKSSGIKFDFENDLPMILVMGGGTGATAINNMVEESLKELIKICNIIHITGKGKDTRHKTQDIRYKQFDFLNRDEMSEALRTSDLIVTRAGLGTLTEIAYLKKPSIIIPMPDTHQEDNVKIFREKKAALVLDQKKLNIEGFIKNIKDLLEDKKRQEEYSKNIFSVIKGGANERVVEIIEEILGK